MLSNFGKKKLSTQKIMYCIKRTKVGKRVVKVETVTRKGRQVKIYSSSRRVVGSSVKCFPRKTQAQAELKKMKEGKMSSFGARKNVATKSISPYGYTACIDPNHELNYNSKKFKVFKYNSVTHNRQKYRVVIIKDKYTKENKYFLLPEDHKGYNVKTKGSVKEREESNKIAKERATRLAKDMEVLSYTPESANLIECDWKNEADSPKAYGAPSVLRNNINPFINSMNNPKYLKYQRPTHHATQIEDALRRNFSSPASIGGFNPSFQKFFTPSFGRINYGFSKYF